MAAAIRRLVAIDARGNHHVEPLFDEHTDHCWCARRVVGRVTIDQHVDFGFHVVKHPPHHVALALIGLAADHGARRPRRFDGTIGGIVVINVDRRVGHRRAEIGDNLGNGLLFIVTRDQNRHLMPGSGHVPGKTFVARHQPSWNPLGPSRPPRRMA